MVPGPAVHPDLAAPTPLPGANRDGAALSVNVGLGQRERFTDPQASTPEHDEHAAQPDPLGPVARGSHHCDDLLDVRRVRRIAKALVPRRAAPMEAGQRCGRPTPPGVFQQS
jgi:hypothetical protein